MSIRLNLSLTEQRSRKHPHGKVGKVLLTQDLRQAVDQAGHEPVRLTDPTTNRSFVLVRAEEFDRMKALISDDPVEQMRPFMIETFSEGWNDPALDVYIDPRKS